MKRESLFEFARENFNSEPEYLWSNLSDYAVLRHHHRGKWFGLVMSVTGKKLGLETNDQLAILNVKVRPELVGALRQMEGVLPAYHMNKEHWVSILLDASLSPKEIHGLLTDSYVLTSKVK